MPPRVDQGLGSELPQTVDVDREFYFETAR